MTRPSFNHSQRVVCVLGLGLALYALGEWITNLGARVNFGWVAYAPLSSSVGPSLGPPTGLHPWARLLVWLVAIALWVVASLVIFRESSPASDGTVGE